MSDLRQQQGLIAIEFIMVLPILLLLIWLSFDLNSYLIKQGQLDRLSYQAVTLLAQRSQYQRDDTGDIAPLVQSEVADVTEWLEQRLTQAVRVKVTVLTGDDTDKTKDDTLESSNGDANCQLSSGAFYLQHQLLMPLYVVDICYSDNQPSLVGLWRNDSISANYHARSMMVER